MVGNEETSDSPVPSLHLFPKTFGKLTPVFCFVLFVQLFRLHISEWNQPAFLNIQPFCGGWREVEGVW